jgi:hypothetical protein
MATIRHYIKQFSWPRPWTGNVSYQRALLDPCDLKGMSGQSPWSRTHSERHCWDSRFLAIAIEEIGQHPADDVGVEAPPAKRAGDPTSLYLTGLGRHAAELLCRERTRRT